MEEDAKNQQGIEGNVEVEEDEIVDTTYCEKSKQPSLGSVIERNTVEGEKDHSADTPNKISNVKLGRSRKAKDKGAEAVDSAGGATYCTTNQKDGTVRTLS